jgi:hypothetical protein
MGLAPWLKVYIADEMWSGRFFMSVILLVDGLHELYAGTAGGGQVNCMEEVVAVNLGRSGAAYRSGSAGTRG